MSGDDTEAPALIRLRHHRSCARRVNNAPGRLPIPSMPCARWTTCPGSAPRPVSGKA
jgi:hypothetical protein